MEIATLPSGARNDIMTLPHRGEGVFSSRILCSQDSLKIVKKCLTNYKISIYYKYSNNYNFNNKYNYYILI